MLCAYARYDEELRTKIKARYDQMANAGKYQTGRHMKDVLIEAEKYETLCQISNAIGQNDEIIQAKSDSLRS